MNKEFNMWIITENDIVTYQREQSPDVIDDGAPSEEARTSISFLLLLL
jgi:hypothetical protein